MLTDLHLQSMFIIYIFGTLLELCVKEKYAINI